MGHERQEACRFADETSSSACLNLRQIRRAISLPRRRAVFGYSARSLVHHVAAGHFERIGRGFYRMVGVPADSHEDIIAAWLDSRHVVPWSLTILRSLCTSWRRLVRTKSI